MCCAHRQLCPDALLMPDAVCLCSPAQQPRSACTPHIFRTRPLARSAMHATSASAPESASSSQACPMQVVIHGGSAFSWRQVLGVRLMFAGERGTGRLPTTFGRMPSRSLNI